MIGTLRGMGDDKLWIKTADFAVRCLIRPRYAGPRSDSTRFFAGRRQFKENRDLVPVDDVPVAGLGEQGTKRLVYRHEYRGNAVLRKSFVPIRGDPSEHR